MPIGPRALVEVYPPPTLRVPATFWNPRVFWAVRFQG
jgi:hypothetical protein